MNRKGGGKSIHGRSMGQGGRGPAPGGFHGRGPQGGLRGRGPEPMRRPQGGPPPGGHHPGRGHGMPGGPPPGMPRGPRGHRPGRRPSFGSYIAVIIIIIVIWCIANFSS